MNNPSLILELKERLEKIKPGEKLTLKIDSFFGSTIYIKVTYCGEIKQHGYLLPSGGWGLYKTDSNDVECYKALFREYKKKTKYYIKLGYTIKDFKIGW